MAKPACKGTTKAGKACKAPPLKGTDFCLAHSPANVRESAGFVADNGKAGRPRLPRPTEIARDLIERHIEVTLAPHFRTLGYNVVRNEAGQLDIVKSDSAGAKLYGESKDGDIVMTHYDDLAAQIAAAEKLLDRIYGRPKQATELSGPEGGAIPLGGEVPSDADFHKSVAQILQEAGATAPK